MADTFDPMGLNQEQLKKLIFSNVTPKKNWTDGIKKALRIRGQAQFNTRFIWKGLPEGYDSQQIERMLYYRGLLGMFYDPEYGFLILPAKQCSSKSNNSINFMGRWKFASPTPYNGAGEDKKETNEDKVSKLVLQSIGEKQVLWSVPFVTEEEDAKNIIKNSCVLLYDYTPQISEIPIARQVLEDPFYDGEIEIVKMIRTASLNSTGVQWVRVSNEAEAQVMRDQFKIYDDMILNGVRYLCISATTEIQEGATKSTAQMQEFWTSFQSLENLRLSCIGMANDGIQQKSQYQNMQEQQLDNIGNSPVLLDGWLQRVRFCTIANAVWGLSMGVEVAGMDTTGAGGEPAQEETNSADDGAKGDTSND